MSGSDAREACEHCWHRVGGYANCLGSAGEDYETCCFCGMTRKMPWVGERDPKHGKYAVQRIKVYTK